MDRSKIKNITIIFVFLFIICLSLHGFSIDKIEQLTDAELFKELNTIEKQRKRINWDKSYLNISSEITRRIKIGSLELENNIITELKNKNSVSRDLLLSYIGKTRYFKNDSSFKEILNIINSGMYDSESLCLQKLILTLAYNKYYPSLDMMISMGFNNHNVSIEVNKTAKKAIAIIGKPGIDYYIGRLNELEENNEINKGWVIIWALGYSKDPRVVDIALKCVDSDDICLKRSALTTLARLGGSLPEGRLKRVREHYKAGHFDNDEFWMKAENLSEEKKKTIEQILINALGDNEPSIREISAFYLRYYPDLNVINSLRKCEQDPHISRRSCDSQFEDYFPIREKAKESLTYLKEYYPELFVKNKIEK